MSLTPFTETKILFQEIKGINVFYRAAGPLNAPVILLLHGFPSSSFQYRNLITKLAIKYRVIVSAKLSPEPETLLSYFIL